MTPSSLNSLSLQAHIDLWLKEDIGSGDHTSLSTIPDDATGSAVLIAKEGGILAGLQVADTIFKSVSKALYVKQHMADGDKMRPGDQILKVDGTVQSILTAERLVLNVMQRMSGIATATKEYTKLIGHTNAKLLDTRKTTPGFRLLEKEAVSIGGGINHRFGLYDMILIKDNHIDFAGGIEAAISSCLRYLEEKSLDLKIEVEVRSLEDIEKVLKSGHVDRILLDNFSVEMTRQAVKMINKQCETESSGGINKTTIRDYAECGVDYISIGALTHQINSLDLSLKANF
ncbi:MAG TPA: carboxylating nicotinate-nucleotide diphosphorylase [Bacteroidales bacterium]|nr:carboxylating nicotinate-nucleotide diphosphorylase [Bacteroidales bacterium]